MRRPEHSHGFGRFAGTMPGFRLGPATCFDVVLAVAARHDPHKPMRWAKSCVADGPTSLVQTVEGFVGGRIQGHADKSAGSATNRHENPWRWRILRSWRPQNDDVRTRQENSGRDPPFVYRL